MEVAIFVRFSYAVVLGPFHDECAVCSFFFNFFNLKNWTQKMLEAAEKQFIDIWKLKNTKIEQITVSGCP